MREINFNVVKAKNIITGEETDIPAIKGEGINYDAEIDQLADEIEAVNNRVGELPHDVQINGTSIVSDGVANVPIASETTPGVVKTNSYSFGIGVNASGQLYVNRANNTQIVDRNLYPPITGGNFDFAVKTAMCDGRGAEWSEAEQIAAQQRIGILNVEGVGF